MIVLPNAKASVTVIAIACKANAKIMFKVTGIVTARARMVYYYIVSGIANVIANAKANIKVKGLANTIPKHKCYTQTNH